MVTCCTLGYRASRGQRGECGCRTRSRTRTRSNEDWHRPTPEQESQIKTVATGGEIDSLAKISVTQSSPI